MVFTQAIETVASALLKTGTTIDPNNYDGVIVKKLEASNTLDDGRTTNQTHIAITGSQMDIFPYLRSDGYFNDATSDTDLKKYYITQIPLALHKSNVEYLDDSQTEIHFDSEVKSSYTSVVRSKRKSQADQIQVSLINFDGPDFVAFRKMLHSGSYLVILKLKQKFEYEAYGLVPNRGIESDGGLQALNNQFSKLATNTTVNVSSLLGIANTSNNIESSRLTTGENVLLYGVPGSGKSWTIEHEYCKPGSVVERLVFHPDYTYSDFIGQILPAVAEDGQVSYKFTPGPFTNILRESYHNPGTEYILIIEEINRGNALINPEIHNVITCLPDIWILPVQIRLFFRKQMQIILSACLIIFPCRPLETACPVVRFMTILWIHPYIIVTIWIVPVFSAFHKPWMFIACVVENNIQNDTDASLMRLTQKFIEIFHRSKFLLYIIIG